MIPESKWKQYGLPDAQIKGIVIHNTNNQLWNAKRLEKWLVEENGTSAACHFLVDADETIQVMPLDWSVWNTGMGYDFGNLHCISIEVVSHPSERKYLEGEKRAIQLIKELMEQFNLTEKDIYFHRDFNPNVNCPAQILRRYGNKQNFLNLLKGEK